MYRMAQPIPPLSSIRAFEAAARHESLRIAADRLGVTPSAISHQIKVLEEWVGAPVFVRVGRDVRLSRVGRELARDVAHAFDVLSRSFGAARQSAAETTLRVSTLPLFAQAWLLPRLSRFEQAHPGIAIVLDTTSRLLDFEVDPVDIAIRNSAKPSGRLAGRKLLDLRAVPLCAPAVAKRISGPRDLAKMTLIHLSVGAQGWPDWFALNGASGLKAKSSLTLDTMTAAIEAAAAGHAVMLGLAPLVWDLPVAKGLVVPFDAEPVPAGAYYLVHRKSDRARRPVRLFVEWITREMQRDAKRLHKLSKLRGFAGDPEATVSAQVR